MLNKEEEFVLSKEQEKVIKEIEATLIHKLVKIDFSWLIRRIGELQFNEKEFIRLLEEKYKKHGTIYPWLNQLTGDKLVDNIKVSEEDNDWLGTGS